VNGDYNRKGASKNSGNGLATQLRYAPTFRASDSSRGGNITNASAKHSDLKLGGPPNPEWVEWYMGWPIGWTALEPLATDKFQQWLNSHGKR
jgi:hypothetical protein